MIVLDPPLLIALAAIIGSIASLVRACRRLPENDRGPVADSRSSPLFIKLWKREGRKS